MPASFSPSFSAATIESVLERLFPDGTRGRRTTDESSQKNAQAAHGASSLDHFPMFPSDLFAASAYLLERGDAYRRIAPDGSRRGTTNSVFSLPSDQKEKCQAIGQEWADIFHSFIQNNGASETIIKRWNAKVSKPVQVYWDTIVANANRPLLDTTSEEDPDVGFWRAVLALLIIADHACHNLGFNARRGWFDRFSRVVVLDDDVEDDGEEERSNGTGKAPVEAIKGDSKHFRYVAYTDTVCILVNPYVIRVLPKSRTPAVGCTMRTLSANLALLPPRGSVNMHWFHPVGEPEPDGKALNILAIPYPYEIAASDFRPDIQDQDEPRTGWGWFGVSQTWLPTDTSAVAHFALALVRKAERDCGAVHGIVFPEYALNWETYAELVRQIRVYAPHVEFIVAGSSSDCTGAKGNFVLTTTFAHAKDDERKALTYSRAKHHRWRLDKHQINEYGLASALDPHKLWWEDMLISTREVGLMAFREKSVFSALICEDLARSEPCHSAVRSVGPNLVFVLLMDGAQIASRWSARYATSLADDPGCAVLTLTSRGLITRVNQMGRRNPNSAVALWKDDVNSVSSLHLPKGAAALLLTLSAEEATEATLDGRKTPSAAAWRYHNHMPIMLAPGHASYQSILNSI